MKLSQWAIEAEFWFKLIPIEYGRFITCKDELVYAMDPLGILGTFIKMRKNIPVDLCDPLDLWMDYTEAVNDLGNMVGMPNLERHVVAWAPGDYPQGRSLELPSVLAWMIDEKHATPLEVAQYLEGIGL